MQVREQNCKEILNKPPPLFLPDLILSVVQRIHVLVAIVRSPETNSFMWLLTKVE